MNGLDVIPGSERCYSVAADGRPDPNAQVVAPSAERETARLRQLVEDGRHAQARIDEWREDALFHALRVWRREA
jgi:hypothetical protein